MDEEVKAINTAQGRVRVDRDSPQVPTLLQLRRRSKKLSLEELKDDTEITQARAIWLAWKITYEYDLSSGSEAKQIEAARKLASQTINYAFLKPNPKTPAKKQIEPVKVEFNGKKK